MAIFRARTRIPLAHAPGRMLTRLAPAVGMAVALIAGGIWSGTIRHDPAPAFLAHWGYDLDILRAGRWYTLVTMTLFPTAHSDWLPMLGQTVLLVALAGWCAGPWWAVAAFWLPNLVGTALVSLGIIWPLDAAGVAFAHRWAMEPDSGASVGIYGALGFLLPLLPRPLRWVAIGGMAAWLLVAVVRERHVWNIEHCGGYVLGVLLVRWRRRHDAPSSNSAAIPQLAERKCVRGPGWRIRRRKRRDSRASHISPGHLLSVEPDYRTRPVGRVRRDCDNAHVVAECSFCLLSPYCVRKEAPWKASPVSVTSQFERETSI